MMHPETVKIGTIKQNSVLAIYLCASNYKRPNSNGNIKKVKACCISWETLIYKDLLFHVGHDAIINFSKILSRGFQGLHVLLDQPSQYQ